MCLRSWWIEGKQRIDAHALCLRVMECTATCTQPQVMHPSEAQALYKGGMSRRKVLGYIN